MTGDVEVQALAQRILMELDSVHDYYAFTNAVYRFVQQVVEVEERQFFVQNKVTGTVADEVKIVALSQSYITSYLASASLEKFVSLLEDFLVGLKRVWLRKFPGKMNANEMKFDEIAMLPDKQAIIDRFIDKEIQKFTYKRPEMWFRDFNESAKLDVPSPAEIDQFCEIKATRDVLVHNQSVANWTYLDKSKQHARYIEGDLVQIPDDYLRTSWELIKKIVQDMSAATIAKLS